MTITYTPSDRSIRVGGLLILRIERVSYHFSDRTRTDLDRGETDPADGSLKFTRSDSGENDARLSIEKEDDVVRVGLTARARTEAIRPHRQFDRIAGVRIQLSTGERSSPFLAFNLFKEWWTRPEIASESGALPARSQMLTWKLPGIRRLYAALLTVASGDITAWIAGSPDGLDLELSSYEHGRVSVRGTPLFVATDEDPFRLITRLGDAAVAHAGTPARPRREKKLPEPLEYLGWCSWDAYYTAVDAEGLRAKAREFQEKRLPVKWFMIDDGWLSVADEALTAFEPDPEKFPDGLKPVIAELKRDYGIRDAGVWHALGGYWGGVHPASSLSTEYADHLLTTTSDRRIPHPVTGYQFWAAWYRVLRDQGVTMVKVDGQSGLKHQCAGTLPAVPTAARSLELNEAAIALHFGGNAIHCMGMSNETHWGHGAAPLVRNSNDFVPDDELNFRELALENPYNALFNGILYHTDWDMFWTRHPQAVGHAVLRAVSGGPVYVSDRPGETDAEILRPLIADDGRILMCDQPGLPTEDSLFRDIEAGEAPLKIWNTAGDMGLIAAIAAWGDSDRQEVAVRASDIPGFAALAEGARFILHDYFSGTWHEIGRDEALVVQVSAAQPSLYRIWPLGRPAAIAPLGSIDGYVPSAALRDIVMRDDGFSCRVTKSGRFAVYDPRESALVRVNGESRTPQREASGVRVVAIIADDVDALVEVESTEKRGENS